VVGGGPVGLACAVEATRAGLSAIVLEKAGLLNTLQRFPTYTTFFSTPELLEIGGVPFVTAGGKPSRREALVYYRKVKERWALDARLYERVVGLRGEAGSFTVVTERGEHAARRAVVATGFFDHPRLLGVPGEELPKVSHYYREAFPYSGTDVLIVGGKNSAVETALDLCRSGARVTMCVRGTEFGKSVKYWLRPDVENRVAEGSIRALFSTCVEEIRPRSVVLRRGEERLELPNDFVLALTGYRPDFDFLRALGIEVSADGHLLYDESTMETTVPGLYVAGVVAAGVDIGKLFIENGRLHAAVIAKHVAQALGRDVETPAPPALRRFQDGD